MISEPYDGRSLVAEAYKDLQSSAKSKILKIQLSGSQTIAAETFNLKTEIVNFMMVQSQRIRPVQIHSLDAEIFHWIAETLTGLCKINLGFMNTLV